MQNAIIEQYQGFQKAALDAAREIQEVTARTTAKALEQQFELLGFFAQAAARQATLLTEAKSARDLAAAQAELAKETVEKLAAASRATFDLFNETRNDVTKWVEEKVENQVEEIKKVSTPKVA